MVLRQNASEAGAVAMNPVVFVQAMLPHREQYQSDAEGKPVLIPTGRRAPDGSPEVERAKAMVYSATNGGFALTVTAGTVSGPTRTSSRVSRGVPYGGLPRLLLAYIITQARKQDSRVIDLGGTLTSFCETLDITPSGGANGRLGYVYDQMRRLSSCTIAWERQFDRVGRRDAYGENVLIVDSFHFWERDRDDSVESGGTITLSQRFWDDIVGRCFPIDYRKAQYFRHYPTAYDLYLWLTYKLGSMERMGQPEVTLGYDDLHAQLGSHYATGPDGKLLDDAKRRFGRKIRKALKDVQATWPALMYDTPRGRVTLYATGPDVRHKPRRKGSD